MKIGLVSDLHIDVSGYQELPGGDVLIVAGDVCEARVATKEHHSTKLLYRLPGSFPCADFFEFECAKYKKVFYVLGNFVHVSPSTIVINKYSNSPNARIGLTITEDIVDYINKNVEELTVYPYSVPYSYPEDIFGETYR